MTLHACDSEHFERANAGALRNTNSTTNHPTVCSCTRLPCCCLINHAVGNDDTIVAFRIFNGDQAVEHIVQHLPRIALARIADAAAARQAKLNRVAWWHGLPSLGADRPARA